MNIERLSGYVGQDCAEFVVAKKQDGYIVAFWDAFSALLFNPETLRITTYCEHDVTLDIFNNEEAFKTELARNIHWYNTEYAA